MISNQIADSVRRASEGDAFRNYLYVRERVFEMLDAWSRTEEAPSAYWEEELAGFDYMFDASPLIVERLREHCYHLTGLRSYDYRQHHGHRQAAFEEKLAALRAAGDDSLFVPESALLGGFGHTITGSLVNLDTLKFFECLIALDRSEFLVPFRTRDRCVSLEIGAGWGGFAFQFKTLFADASYVIIDLPQTMLFSGTYLRTAFPDRAFYFYGESPLDELSARIDSYDFVFLPSFALKEIQLSNIDLAINMVSFQEMTSAQVSGYAERLSDLGCSRLYSLNRDRSPHNSQLSTVSSLLSEFYDLQPIAVLDVPYTSLRTKPKVRKEGKQRPQARASTILQDVRARGARVVASAGDGIADGSSDYRHLAGVRK